MVKFGPDKFNTFPVVIQRMIKYIICHLLIIQKIKRSKDATWSCHTMNGQYGYVDPASRGAILARPCQ